MAQKVKELEKYTAASLAVAEFKKSHAKTFDRLNELLVAASAAEAALKAVVRDDIKDTISNEFVRVTFTPAFSKSYDVDTILKLVTPAEKKALNAAGAITVSTVIDGAKFDELVEQGKISKEIKQAAFREKELAARVSIKEVRPE